MSQNKIDRRTFLKIMGTAGASAAALSVVGPAAIGEAYSGKPFGSGPAGLDVFQKAGDVLAKVPKDKLADMYSKINKARKWETTMKDLFLQGKDDLYGAYHLYVGEEAVAVGVCGALNKDDYIASTHRGHGHLIAKGGDLNKMSAEIYVKQDGYNKGWGGSMHITDLSLGILGMNGIVGASWYPVAGAAYASKVRGDKRVAVAFGGDGASNSVYFFSAVRSAVTYSLPAIFVIENNGYQIATPTQTNVPSGHASTYFKGLGITSVTIDGNDVAEVYANTAEAVEKARNGGGPTVIEAMTYRWYDHYGFAGAKVGVDGAFGLPYRPDSEVKWWMSNDPIPRFKAFLIERKLFTADELTKIETDAQAAVDASLDFARKSPAVKATDGLKNVFAGEIQNSVVPTQFFNAVAPTAWIQHEQKIAGRDVPLNT